jgi:chromosome partition protein MukE
MTATKFLTLGDAVEHEEFPAVDLALRRGRHIDRDDASWFGFLADAADVLEPFYRRFGAELVYRSDGFYYLLPAGDRLAKRHLSVAEMLVGQALTLLYLEPGTVEQGGRVRREQVLAHLATVMGTDALVRALNPKRRRYDERVAQETVRSRVADAIRRLTALGFVEALGADELKLRPALLRFAEPVRAAADAGAALSKLVASGELALTPLDAVPEGGAGDFDEEADGEEAAGEEAAEAGDDATAEDEPAGAAAQAGAPSPAADAALPAEPPAAPVVHFDPSLFEDFGFEDVAHDPGDAEPPDAGEEPE